MIGIQECGPAPPRQIPGGSSARERAAQAVDFYNSHVLKARVNAGLAAPRSSFNDRHHYHGTPGTRRHHLAQDALYRSNSSLELQEPRAVNASSPTLRRDYGSHGSIDVIDRPGPVPGTSESFFAMLQDYRPAVLGVISTEQRSPGPSEYLRGKVDGPMATDNGGVSEVDGLQNTPHSPKLRSKLQRFWGGGGGGGGASSAVVNNNNAVGGKLQRQTLDDSAVSLNSSNSVTTSSSADMEERQRRRAFAHYDCQSLTANLGYAAKLRGLLLARRRNTTTGASAASMLTRSSTPDGDSGDEDAGDGQCNDLLDNCPFFRNEIGGEEERVVSLTRVQNGQKTTTTTQRRPLHRPPLAYGVAVLEFPPGETQWRHSTCPYHRIPRPIESVDQGALYYRKYYYNQEHQNWFGMDEQLGPVAISIRREKLVGSPHSDSSNVQHQYRLVIRTSELLTLRGAILEDAIPSIRSSNGKTMNTKEVLEFVAPEIQMNCLRLGVQSQQTEEQVLKLDEQGLTNHYKVGIMYCKAGQSTEEEMYNNEDAGPAFTEFLETIGQKVRLKGFDKYKAGLDNKTDSTGLYSVYSQYQDCEIMFHVSTMLPFTPNNRQQLLRKRHIGNDIVTIVFQEPGALPFTPKSIRSQFQHVFIIVRAINPCTENTHYSVAVSRSKDVQVFGPPIKKGAIFPKSKTFADFLLAKVVNAENAAHRSEKFVTMATRTRQEYLKDLANNYCTTTVVDTGQKFSIFSSKKKEKTRQMFISDACQRGAICWQVILDDSGQSQQIECYLGISTDTLVLIEECSRQIVFVTPCKAILGWSPQANSIRVYHHQGECTTMHMRDSTGDRDELMEIMDRLRAVTQGCLAQELSLKRNSMGQLGFHVQPDGVVTQVENLGQAWQAGLRQGSRLVEICKVAVSTLSHDQMVDLLKTSMMVTVTVIPPLQDNTPRRGCTLHICKYNSEAYEGDYENLNTDETKGRKGAQLQQAVPGNHRRRYERSFSPPRSSNSSGYGTGSSSKSFLAPDTRFSTNPEGTMTSSSSGHSSDDRWYELLETPEHDTVLAAGVTPPPLPARVLGNPSPVRNNLTSAFVTPKQTNLTHSIQQLRTQNHVHNKIQTNGLHPSYSLPLNAAQSIYNDCDYNYKQMDKVNVNKIQNDLRMRQEADYMVVARSMHQPNLNDGHSTDSSISDRLFAIGSEDELSNGSGGNVSPRLRRANKHRTNNLTTSSNNSRNNSPRSMNGEAKLRPGVTPRSSNRNSANLSTSNLQENLMKLIDPDYVMDDGVHETTTQNEMYHSRETLNNSLAIHQNSQPSSKAEVILTMARPATVISNASTTSSPLPIEFKSVKDDRLSPRVNKNKNNMAAEVLPLPGDINWPSLVDTATRAMMQVHIDPEHEVKRINNNKESNVQWNEDIDRGLPIDASISSMVSSSASVPELQNHLSELETLVSHETRRRLSLEDEVRRLREENRRLQDESQAAAHQLRKFTEWFFKNIDRQ